ncbi:9921_t:CDS:1, partial [Cetraspora pellucida]
MSENQVILDEQLEKLDDGLKVLSKNLRLACSSLRSICVDNTVFLEGFVNFRRKVLKYAFVYSKVIFPYIKEMASEIQNYMENYAVLSFEEFRDDINFLAEDISEKRKLFVTTLAFHVAIQEDFEREKNEADNILKKLENETPLSIERLMKLVESLIMSIQHFVNALKSIAQSFITLEDELKNIIDHYERENDYSNYYNKCRGKAKSIIDNCLVFFYEIPNCEADLAAITFSNNDDY